MLSLAAAALLAAVAYAWAPASDPASAVPEPLPLPAVALAAAPEAEAPDDAERDAPETGAIDAPPEAAEEVFLEGSDDDSEDVVLRGRVVPAFGPQPEGIHVVLDRADDCGEDQPDDAACDHFRTYADADPETGDFELSAPPGSYRLVARADGFLPAHEQGLTLTRGEELGEVLLTLERGERISGTVHHEDEPQTGARVFAIGEGFVREGVTDEIGHFEIEGLPHGSFVVRAYVEPYGGDERTVSSGASVALVIDKRERVHGRVVDARGFPVEGAVVYSDYEPTHENEQVRDPWPEGEDFEIGGLGMHGCGPTPSCYERATTDAAGRFELETSPGELLLIGARLGDLRAFVTGADWRDGKEVVMQLEPLGRAKSKNPNGEVTLAPNGTHEVFLESTGLAPNPSRQPLMKAGLFANPPSDSPAALDPFALGFGRAPHYEIADQGGIPY